jgi:Outer membrane protein beta-barrel domain
VLGLRHLGLAQCRLIARPDSSAGQLKAKGAVGALLLFRTYPLRSLLTALLLCTSLAALAEEESPRYIGGSYGTSRWDFGFQPGLSTDDRTHAQRVWAGYDGGFVAAELGWVKFGQVLRADGQGREGSLLARGLSLDLLFKLPLGPVEPYVKAGPVWARTQLRGSLFGASAESLSTEETKFGLGVQLKLGRNGLLRAEYERYSMGRELGLGDVNVYTVGAGFRF